MIRAGEGDFGTILATQRLIVTHRTIDVHESVLLRDFFGSVSLFCAKNAFSQQTKFDSHVRVSALVRCVLLPVLAEDLRRYGEQYLLQNTAV